ncbi:MULTISPECIES: SLBB domain-containing protein [unclassified Caballeronia]|uniref:SLBB domain-containing protein n=1 Tax=unclassified Caballeronia TaxID=2646786 RepID=UPI002864B003|nr:MULTISPECIES: SLBB domain-containing protein [unclassified Caballeronia]MDR5751973.1 SLBB domain-containing protein [Caballeronia sp. LZ024]MDR5843886.1 SLBB domain-containing protein [Caballeronia sp. LZ031]
MSSPAALAPPLPAVAAAGAPAPAPQTLFPDKAERAALDAKMVLPEANEYEKFVAQATGRKLQRFGAGFFASSASLAGASVNAVPPDYQINVGDEILLRTWGSVDSDLRLVVDREGYVNVPRVGRIAVSGARYGDLPGRFRAEISRYYASFDLSVSLGHLRGVTVYVTGFATRPGAYVVNSLATLLNVLVEAGGPDSGGSMRNIELRRSGRLVSVFDGYQLLLSGDRAGDVSLQPGDIVNIGPLGQQVAIYGSVNAPGIFEMKRGEHVRDLVRFAGGLNTVADHERITVATLHERATTGVEEAPLEAKSAESLTAGDIYRVYSTADYMVPIARQMRRVRIEGEVARPGDYLVAGTATLPTLIDLAGGLTPQAFLYGSELDRESVRRTQQANYDRALQDMERAVSARATLQANGKDDAESQKQQLEAGQRFLAKLRELRPTGRIVLETAPDDITLPMLTLEDGDRLMIPPRPTTVGVYGSVFNQGSYLYRPTARLGDYIGLAGGEQRTAHKNGEFVLRANGTTRSNQQGWFSSISSLDALPGDTVFVPEDLERVTWWQATKEFTAILYQFGLGAAALKFLIN